MPCWSGAADLIAADAEDNRLIQAVSSRRSGSIEVEGMAVGANALGLLESLAQEQESHGHYRKILRRRFSTPLPTARASK